MKTPSLMVIGTDTDVGKTEVCCRLIQDLQEDDFKVGVYKPACSGSVRTTHPTTDGEFQWADIERLYAATQGEFLRETICPQCFHAPAAPPQAAALEQKSVDQRLLVDGLHAWEGCAEGLIIEGVGGLMSPLSDEWTVLDFARELNLPVLIVGRLGLGTINHTCMTVEVARTHGLTIRGIILSEVIPGEEDPSVSGNTKEIERRSGCPVLAILPYDEKPVLLHSGKRVRISASELFDNN